VKIIARNVLDPNKNIEIDATAYDIDFIDEKGRRLTVTRATNDPMCLDVRAEARGHVVTIRHRAANVVYIGLAKL
jgi:hypothetical protein